MLRLFSLLLTALLSLTMVCAQNGVGIRTSNPHASAALDVSATNQGFLPPRMTAAQRMAIASPAEGLMVYDTDSAQLMHWDGTQWGVTLEDLPLPENGVSAVITQNGVVLTHEATSTPLTTSVQTGAFEVYFLTDITGELNRLVIYQDVSQPYMWTSSPTVLQYELYNPQEGIYYGEPQTVLVPPVTGPVSGGRVPIVLPIDPLGNFGALTAGFGYVLNVVAASGPPIYLQMTVDPLWGTVPVYDLYMYQPDAAIVQDMQLKGSLTHQTHVSLNNNLLQIGNSTGDVLTHAATSTPLTTSVQTDAFGVYFLTDITGELNRLVIYQDVSQPHMWTSSPTVLQYELYYPQDGIYYGEPQTVLVPPVTGPVSGGRVPIVLPIDPWGNWGAFTAGFNYALNVVAVSGPPIYLQMTVDPLWGTAPVYDLYMRQPVAYFATIKADGNFRSINMQGEALPAMAYTELGTGEMAASGVLKVYRDQQSVQIGYPRSWTSTTRSALTFGHSYNISDEIALHETLPWSLIGIGFNLINGSIPRLALYGADRRTPSLHIQSPNNYVGINALQAIRPLTLGSGTVRLEGLAGQGNQPLIASPDGTLGLADGASELQHLTYGAGSLSLLPAGGSVNLPDPSDTNEWQSLSLSGQNLAISDGNSISLPAQLGNHEASQSLRLSGFHLSNDGDNEGLEVSNSGHAGINQASPNTSYPLAVSGPSNGYQVMRISGNGSIGTAFTLHNQLNISAHSLISTASGAGAGAGCIGVFDENVGAYRFVINELGDARFYQNLTISGTLTGIGQAFCSGTTAICSDRRYKRDIQPLNGMLGRIAQVEGVSYQLRAEEFPEKQFSTAPQIGVIAQDLEALFPQMVITDPATGYKSVDYSRLTPALVQAVQELQAQVEALRQRNATLRQAAAQHEQLRATVSQLSLLISQQTATPNNN